MIEQKAKNKAKKLKQKFETMSFKYKLLFVFVLSSLVTLAVTDITMTILILNFGQQDLHFITQKNTQFNQFSTLQVVQALTKSGVTGRDISTTLIYELCSAYSYFSQKRDAYSSLQTTNPYFPPLSTSFNRPQFIPSIYFYSQTSTFYQDPFFDTVLSVADRSHYRTLKRINIIYYNTQNNADIMARTLPATNDFIIKNPQDVASRFQGLQLQYVDRTNIYTDTFSKKDNTTQLVAVRSFLISKDNPKVKILIQVQLVNRGLVSLLNTVYYFPSTNVLFIQPNRLTGRWYASSSTKQVDFDITPMVQPGIRNVTLENGTQVIAGTVGLSAHAPLNSFHTFTYSNDTVQRFVVVTQTNQTKTPYNFMENFIKRQNIAIFTIIYVWSLFIFCLCLGMALTVGDNIFKHLKFLSQKIKCYIQNPRQKGNIIQELHSIPIKGVVRQLIKRIIQIIRKIQNSKKQIQQSKKIKLPVPLNICQREFQIRNGISDYQILQRKEVQLAKKYQGYHVQ